MTRSNILCGIGLAATVLLMTGCGDDPPGVALRSGGPAASTGHAPPVPALAPAPSPPAGNDPQVTPDQLTADADGPSSDALSSGSSPLAEDDTMTSEPKMPTEHSHWLRGGIFNARVAVALNGRPLGEFQAPVDKDVTMRLRRGANTVTFVYTPETDTSSAHLDLLESEHHPPIAPLASFSVAPLAETPRAAPNANLPPITKTLTFIAN